MIRVDGDLRKINLPPLEHKDVIKIIYDIMNDRQRKEYEEFFETDFSFEIANLARFRVNAFNQSRGAAAVFRTIPSEILSMEDLGLPTIFKEMASFSRGWFWLLAQLDQEKVPRLQQSSIILIQVVMSIF